MHLEWTDQTIRGSDGLSDLAVVQAIDDGARVVLLECVASIVVYGFHVQRMFLIRPGESVASRGWLATVVTGLFGWWGLGLFATPGALWRNLRGGVDVTDHVRATFAARIVEQQDRARAEVAAVEQARQGSLEDRRTAALLLLERRELDGAWALIGKDVLDGPLRRDFQVVRKLLVTASDGRGQQARAGLLATIVLQDHPDEVKDYIGYLVRKALRDADAPPGMIPKPPFLQTGRGLLTLLLGLAALPALGATALNEWLRLHRDLHVVNGTLDPVVVTVGPTVLRLPPGGRGVAVVEEGTVSLDVERRGVSRPRAVDVHVGFLDRFRPTAVVFNVEGAGVLLQESMVWGDRAPAPEPDRVHVGQELLVLPGVAPFSTFPAEKRLKRGETSVETHVVLRGGHPADLVYQLDGAGIAEALAYLELHARLAPDDARTLDRYADLGLLHDAPRATAFLDAGLLPGASGPWLLAWRRARLQADDALDALVDRVRTLEGPPGAARLAFEALHAPDEPAALALRDRARAAGADEPLLALAEAEAALRRGDLERARTELARATDGGYRRDLALLLARVGAEPDARELLAAQERRLHQVRYTVNVFALLELRATLGGTKGVDAAIGPLLVGVGDGDDAKGWRVTIDYAKAVALGDPVGLRALDPATGPYPALMAALLEGDPGRAAEAAAGVGADPSLADDLSLALALALVKGDAAAARRLRPLVTSAWSAAGPRGVPALEALGASDAPTAIAALDRLTLWPTACHAVRLAVAAALPAGDRRAILSPVLPPRGPGYPGAVIRALREAPGDVRPTR